MSSSESRPRPAPIAVRAAALALLVLCWLLPAASAPADDPVTLARTGQITDTVGALGDRKDAVATALSGLDKKHGTQLFVAYVRDFSGRSAQDWADATADRSGLGLNDVLLAVATHDRQYALSVDHDSPLTDARIRAVTQAGIEPALRQNDWAGAATGAADGIGAALAGQPVPTPAITPGEADPGTAPGSGSGDLVLPLVAVLAAGALAAYSSTRRKRRTRERTTPGRERAAGAGGWGRTPAVSVADLDRQARHLLVETDDAVRTSTEELGFATAQFGDEAVAPFQQALGYAQSELTAAFELRQRLDDAFPEDEPARRRMLDEIISRCTAAGRRLDEESADFDRLRSLERSAPEALAHAEQAAGELSARTDRARATLTALGARYAPSAVVPVAGHVGQARDRLEFAAAQLREARASVGAGDNGKAAVFLRAAEGALDQADTFAAAIERLAGELAAAADALPAALSESEADLADARGLLDGTAQGVSTADLRGRVARAESVVGDVRKEMAAGPYDPVDAVRRVEEADAALDEALAAAREREAGTTRARSLLGQALLAAGSATGAAADFVTTHRGAVGSEARTRLAEAQRHLANARGAQESDPAAALGEAQQADALARQAQALAERDVRAYGNPYGGGGGGSGGAVLGGILLGQLLGGGGRRAGGMGGGGFGGDLGGGPGSFGGGGTRGRRGGGGRF